MPSLAKEGAVGRRRVICNLRIVKGMDFSMKLVNKSIKDFSEMLASDVPAPGGGSAAALEGALGAALISMVASLTVGRKKYAVHEPLMVDILKRTDELRKNMLDIIDRDTEAYHMVSAVFSMPKNTDEEKAIRDDAMQNALKACTITPFDMIQCAYSGLVLIAEIYGKYNKNAASDLGVAVLSLKASAEGAWLNVLINLEGIRDEIFSAKYMISGSDLIQRVVELADDIHANILQDLLP